MGYTWRSDNSSFSPGKLDYILYSDSVLDTAKHFVFNTMTMDSVSLADNGLDVLDSFYSSDHSPRVLDIAVGDKIDVDSNNLIPTQIKISNPYPNPFNPSTKIQFELFNSELLNVTLFDLRGNVIKTISHKRYSPGQYELIVEGKNLSSGVYFIRIDGRQFSQSFKILYIK